jgi:hypothetical protein
MVVTTTSELGYANRADFCEYDLGKPDSWGTTNTKLVLNHPLHNMSLFFLQSPYFRLVLDPHGI